MRRWRRYAIRRPEHLRAVEIYHPRVRESYIRSAVLERLQPIRCDRHDLSYRLQRFTPAPKRCEFVLRNTKPLQLRTLRPGRLASVPAIDPAFAGCTNTGVPAPSDGAAGSKQTVRPSSRPS